MALVKKKMKRYEVDEIDGFNVAVIEFDCIEDDETGEVIVKSKHRKIIEVGDDAAAATEGITGLVSDVWTQEVRDKKNKK